MEPKGLFLKGYSWYLFGYCRTGSDFRIFRLSRMNGLAESAAPFTKRSFSYQDIEAKWECHLAPLSFRTVLLFKPAVRSRVMDDCG